MSYPWYKVLDGNQTDLQQGDFVPDCPIFVPPDNYQADEKLEIELNEIDSIILSQSCDLVNGKIKIVLVCPYYSLKTFVDNLPDDQKTSKARRKVIDNLRKGSLPGYHLLKKDENINELNDYQVVDFRNVYGIQFNGLLQIISTMPERIRLLPPYREHLSQAFARYFMRVGLPQDFNVEGY